MPGCVSKAHIHRQHTSCRSYKNSAHTPCTLSLSLPAPLTCLSPLLLRVSRLLDRTVSESPAHRRRIPTGDSPGTGPTPAQLRPRPLIRATPVPRPPSPVPRPPPAVCIHSASAAVSLSLATDSHARHMPRSGYPRPAPPPPARNLRQEGQALGSRHPCRPGPLQRVRQRPHAATLPPRPPARTRPPLDSSASADCQEGSILLPRAACVSARAWGREGRCESERASERVGCRSCRSGLGASDLNHAGSELRQPA